MPNKYRVGFKVKRHLGRLGKQVEVLVVHHLSTAVRSRVLPTGTTGCLCAAARRVIFIVPRIVQFLHAPNDVEFRVVTLSKAKKFFVKHKALREHVLFW